MTLGRPKSDDFPEKYETSYRLYHLSRPGPAAAVTAVEDLRTYLEWVISRGDEGFCEGDIVNVSALASGVGKSRNTAGKAVEALAAKGMLLQEKPKSPYRIVSRKPIFADTGVVADAQISLTLQFDAPSLISEVGECRLGPKGKDDQIGNLLADEMAASGDPLVSRAATKYWQRGTFQYYLRLRTVEVEGRQTGALLEITYLRLPDEATAAFAAGVRSLREHNVTQISLYPVLEECGLTDLRSGRSHATVAVTPELLPRELGRSVDLSELDLGVFNDGSSVLKWTYGIFHPEAEPLITFSVCYVHTDLLNIFIRNLDVERGTLPG